MESLIKQVEKHIKSMFEGEGTGHDWWHIHRVRNNSVHIAKVEKADLQKVELGALLHDIADHKFHNHNLEAGPNASYALLSGFGAPESLQNEMAQLVREISFKGAQVETPISSLEAACVQDGDRLDAIGAIGIARAFAYGGAHDRLLHHPDSKPELHDDFVAYAESQGPTTAHFYEKLLLLKDRMQTETGRRLADKRHQFMKGFLHQFFDEWDGAK